MPRCEIAESKFLYIYSLDGYCQIALQKVFTSLHSQVTLYERVLFPQWGLAVFSFSNLVCEKYYVVIVLITIQLSDDELF